jgi:CopA family copper-resistance protein
MKSHIHRVASSPVDRRAFLRGAGASLFVAGTSSYGTARAQSPRSPTLSGEQFDLTIGETPVDYTGAPRIATAVNEQVPAPLLRFRQGDTVTLRVTNRLPVRTSIHWHGMIVPADMDGVPGLSFRGIAPGETFTYRFKVNQYGTYWYHAHSAFQEQMGLYGPIVIERRGGERHHADREYVVLLSDWSDSAPEHLLRMLKVQSDYFNFGQQTVGDFFREAREYGLSRALAERRMWNRMRMRPTDLLDVSGYAYTYLMNGATPNGNWTALFQRGERVRLRFINASAMSIFDVRIPDLKMTVVAADGQDVEPVTIDEFRFASAETYDVIVEPKDDRAYTIFAQAMDRSGFARGTLAPGFGMSTTIPPLDPRPLLAMSDMGMDHGAAEQGSTEHDKMDPGSVDDGEVDHSKMDHGTGGASSTDHSGAGHGDASTGQQSGLRHSPTESDPNVDMQATRPQLRIDDPGVGLRDNGRRVLTYADLRTLGGPIDRRTPSREIELHLTGHMERFVWSFDGEKFSQAAPLRFAHGERLRITLVNDTMMTHPIHLHGMWSEIENERAEFLVRKHTVTVQPGQKISYAVTADALGRWAYHCHLLFHMEAGMFREVVVAHGRERAAS